MGAANATFQSVILVKFQNLHRRIQPMASGIDRPTFGATAFGENDTRQNDTKEFENRIVNVCCDSTTS
jgi:hypothetical protein